MSISKSKNWLIITPDNEKIQIKNLAKYCRENNLHNGHMSSIAHGKRNHHKGYKCIKQ